MKLADPAHVGEQYRDSARFDARVRIYELYDTSADALSAVLAQWNRTDLAFGNRVQSIREGAFVYSGPTLDVTTVSDDAEIDTLTGSAGNDWLLLNTAGGTALDKVTDLSEQEKARLLDLAFVNFDGL